jgi:hypothetical protein
LLCECSDLAGELQTEHDERLEPIGLHDEKVGAVEPVIQFAKSIASAFHFDATIDAEQGHGNVAAEAAACGATKRHAFGGKAAILKQAHDRPLGSIAFAPMARPAHVRSPQSADPMNACCSISACSRLLHQTAVIDVLIFFAPRLACASRYSVPFRARKPGPGTLSGLCLAETLVDCVLCIMKRDTATQLGEQHFLGVTAYVREQQFKLELTETVETRITPQLGDDLCE